MPEDEFMQRFDAHLARGEELMEATREELQRNREAAERNREAFERNREVFERNREAFDRNIEAFDRNIEAFERNMAAMDRFEHANDDLREFIREMTLRIERGGREQARALSALTERIVKSTAELRADSRAQREDSRAHTKAILSWIDRMEGGTA